MIGSTPYIVKYHIIVVVSVLFEVVIRGGRAEQNSLDEISSMNSKKTTRKLKDVILFLNVLVMENIP